MNEQQKLYELNYWMAAPEDKNTARQVKLAQLWSGMSQPKLFPGMKVLEIGPGPYGGLLAMLQASQVQATALDPLWPEYREAGFDLSWAGRTKCKLVMEYGDLQKGCYSLILCANVLDHGKADLSELELIHDALAPGGQLHFHLNLRTPEQCNEGHPVSISAAQVLVAMERANLSSVVFQVYDRDPVEDSDYKTIVGVWERK